MKTTLLPALLVLAGSLACNLIGSPPPSATPESATATTAPTDTPPSPTVDGPGEAILITEPGPGSRVLSPIHIAGMANTTFEQHLGVRLLLEDGSELARSSTIIQSEMGTRGPFALDLPFTLSSERSGFIQVFSDSPRDGGITHLASVGVLLATSGPPDLRTAEVHFEDIQILLPAPGATLRGGLIHVEGFGRAGFEQTLVIDILDVDGNVVGSTPVTIESPEMGVAGPFRADISYSVTVEGPGRILVRDVSPAFGGDTHVASVEVTIGP
ncbi:MAG: Gmad2 immunoglobulin-like domain-containing protein [Anaerolineales bacterium]